MTSPEPEPTGAEHSLTPARSPRSRDRRPAPGDAEYDDAELQRGLAAAVLGSLGRLQLRLDAMAREQSEALGELRTAISELDRRLGVIESVALEPVPRRGATQPQ